MPSGGYNRSKWVAERLVEQAADRGLPVTVFRPGPISGHSKTGVFNRQDFLYRLVLGYMESGMAPDGAMHLDPLPVDFVSQAMIWLSVGGEFPKHPNSHVIICCIQNPLHLILFLMPVAKRACPSNEFLMQHGFNT